MPNTSFTFLRQNYWAEEPGTQHVKSHLSNKQEKSTMMVEVLSGLDPLTSHQPKPLVIFFSPHSAQNIKHNFIFQFLWEQITGG